MVESHVPKTESTSTFDLSAGSQDSLSFPNPFSRGGSAEDGKELFSDFLDLDNLQSMELFNIISEETPGKPKLVLQHHLSQAQSVPSQVERPIANQSAANTGHEEVSLSLIYHCFHEV